MLQLKFLVKAEPFPASVCTLSHFRCVQLWDPMDWPTSFLCLWDAPGKNAGVDCHPFLQGIFPTQESNLFLLALPALAGGFFTISTTWEAHSLPSLSNISVILQKAIFPSLPLLTMSLCIYSDLSPNSSKWKSPQTSFIPVTKVLTIHAVGTALKVSAPQKRKKHPKGNRKESQSLRESPHGTYRWQRAWFQNK